ncbi:Transposon Ty3-G Gag-Pol polyprotein [Fagus crenata]
MIIAKKVRVEVPDFAGKIYPQVFSDWLASLERYFEWYDMSDERRVRFAIMKLIGQAQIWWTGGEYDCRYAGQPPIVRWDDMKQKLKQKYLPCEYEDELFEQLSNLSGIEDPRQTLARFKSGLRAEIRSQMITHRTFTIDEAFQLALKTEKHSKQPLARRIESRAPIMQPSYKSNNAIESKGKPTVVDERRKESKDHFFKCREKGHMAWQCPKRNLCRGSRGTFRRRRRG